MTRMDVVDEVRKILLDRLHVRVDDADANLLEAGYVDSLGIVEVVAQVESRFGIAIELDDLDLDDFRSIASIARLVEARTASAGQRTGT